MSVEETLKKDSDMEVGGLDLEKIIKKYILPTVEDLWKKIKIETNESITMGQTLFYTLENWISSIRESKVYIVTTTTLYYMGGFLFKSTIVEPTAYFFGWFPSAFVHWVKTVGNKFYIEINEILGYNQKISNFFGKYILEGVIFLDKSFGSIFYVLGIPAIFSYKLMRNTYDLMVKVTNGIANKIYSTPSEENTVKKNTVKENTDKENNDTIKKNDKKSLGWDLAKIIFPAMATAVLLFSVVVEGSDLVKEK